MPTQQIQLNAQQTNAINSARRILTDLVYELDKADKCGIDCQQERSEVQRLQDGFAKVIQHFGYQGG